MKAADVMDHVVTDLVAAIEAGADGWQMPWRQLTATGPAVNAATGAAYRGANALWFALTTAAEGYPSNRWATYKQWQTLGAQVRRGEHGTHGIYWHTPTHTDDTTTGHVDDSDTTEPTTPATAGPRAVWARAFVVFNAAQLDHDPTPATDDELDGAPLARIEAADTFFAAIPAAIDWGSGSPAYLPAVDRVRMPAFDAFTSAGHAYGTLAHELAHWSGHPGRLDRCFGRRFGDHAYAAEELVAELSAAFTCALLGLDTVTRDDHAAYLASWCQILRTQPSTLWTVAAKAQAATDYLAHHSQPPT